MMRPAAERAHVHVRVGPSSAHLLLNGLIGVVLGRRAVLAILVGLTLQAILFGHGGFLTLGVNTCVMALPALAVGQLAHLHVADDRLRVLTITSEIRHPVRGRLSTTQRHRSVLRAATAAVGCAAAVAVDRTHQERTFQ